MVTNSFVFVWQISLKSRLFTETASKKSKVKSDLDSFCKLMGWGQKKKKKGELFPFPELNEQTGKIGGQDLAKTDVSKEMESSVITNIDKANDLFKYTTSDEKLRKLRRVSLSILNPVFLT